MHQILFPKYCYSNSGAIFAKGTDVCACEASYEKTLALLYISFGITVSAAQLRLIISTDRSDSVLQKGLVKSLADCLQQVQNTRGENFK